MLTSISYKLRWVRYNHRPVNSTGKVGPMLATTTKQGEGPIFQERFIKLNIFRMQLNKSTPILSLKGEFMASVLPTTINKKTTDKQLVALAKAGNKQAFSELFSRHQTTLVRGAMKITKDLSSAEDVVQESMLKAYTKIHMFQERSSFRSWVYRIALNTAKNKIRKTRREVGGVEDLNLSEESQSENAVFHLKLKVLIKELVDGLPDKQKRALVLRIFSDLSFKEIAFLMDCPYDTAKANYRHALTKLKGKIKNNDLFHGWEDLTA